VSWNHFNFADLKSWSNTPYVPFTRWF